VKRMRSLAREMLTAARILISHASKRQGRLRTDLSERTKWRTIHPKVDCP
jgi:hypothetical protein